MRLLKHFLFISLVLLQVFTTVARAQDDSVLPESDTSSGTFVPPPQGIPTPPTLDSTDYEPPGSGTSLEYDDD
jgi:hypothetical protein